MVGTHRYPREQESQRSAVMVLTCKDLKAAGRQWCLTLPTLLLVSCLNIHPLFVQD